MTPGLIRVGDTIINLRNVMAIYLNWVDEAEEDQEPKVVFEFTMRGMDELEEGQNFTEPYVKIFTGIEAEAIRRHLTKHYPDLIDMDI